MTSSQRIHDNLPFQQVPPSLRLQTQNAMDVIFGLTLYDHVESWLLTGVLNDCAALEILPPDEIRTIANLQHSIRCLNDGSSRSFCTFLDVVRLDNGIRRAW
jgi:hypothetical protein